MSVKQTTLAVTISSVFSERHFMSFTLHLRMHTHIFRESNK